MKMQKNVSIIARSVAALVALLMLVMSLAACAKPGEDPQDTTAGPEATTVPDSETESLYEADDLPDSMQLNETITMLYGEDAENVEFFVEDEGNDSVEFAIKTRNAKVEQRLGVTVDYIGTPGNYNNRAAYEKVVRADVAATNDYDIYAAYSMTIANCAYSGFCANLYDYDNILNFQKSWWPKKLTSEAEIRGKLYFASGDISTNMLYMMYVIYFSKELVTDHSLTSPYDLVDTGDWTIDKMIEMIEIVAIENNDDSRIYGLVTSSNVHLDPFYFGAGLSIVDRDADGNIVISDMFSSERAINTATKLGAIFDNGKSIYENGDDAFLTNRALFEVNRARFASQKLSDVDIGFGVIPMPKYDKDQVDYSTCLGFPYTLYAISTGSARREAAAYLLEAMASESYRTVTPALFEVSMKVRYVDDPTAARMFDIIRAGVSFDTGRIFTSSLGNIPFSTFRNSVSNNESYATKSATNKKTLNGYLKLLNKKFESMQ